LQRFTLSPISLTTSHISVREGTNASTILDPCSDCYANKKSTIFKSLIRSDKCIYKVSFFFFFKKFVFLKYFFFF
uniref:Ovule protein n=1 Tax=Brugia pahangi TaxID=6280 RepID=A0A0N4TPI7_BRUPA